MSHTPALIAPFYCHHCKSKVDPSEHQQAVEQLPLKNGRTQKPNKEETAKIEFMSDNKVSLHRVIRASPDKAYREAPA
jgi:hypothetical protein